MKTGRPHLQLKLLLLQRLDLGLQVRDLLLQGMLVARLAVVEVRGASVAGGCLQSAFVRCLNAPGGHCGPAGLAQVPCRAQQGTKGIELWRP